MNMFLNYLNEGVLKLSQFFKKSNRHILSSRGTQNDKNGSVQGRQKEGKCVLKKLDGNNQEIDVCSGIY